MREPLAFTAHPRASSWYLRALQEAALEDKVDVPSKASPAKVGADAQHAGLMPLKSLGPPAYQASSSPRHNSHVRDSLPRQSGCPLCLQTASPKRSRSRSASPRKVMTEAEIQEHTTAALAQAMASVADKLSDQQPAKSPAKSPGVKVPGTTTGKKVTRKVRTQAAPTTHIHYHNPPHLHLADCSVSSQACQAFQTTLDLRHGTA